MDYLYRNRWQEKLAPGLIGFHRHLADTVMYIESCENIFPLQTWESLARESRSRLHYRCFILLYAAVCLQAPRYWGFKLQGDETTRKLIRTTLLALPTIAPAPPVLSEGSK